ncbi:MAG: hypothetical protein GY943_10215, partial [Chloroflexi bacterium]|nr:hypothetical protein [Chloroflexota bacterium]
LEPENNQQSTINNQPFDKLRASQFTIHNSQFTIHYSEIGAITPTADQFTTLTSIITKQKRGLIICGPRCPGGDFPSAVAALAKKCGYPIVADSISGLRFGAWIDNVPIISSYETFMQATPDAFAPDVVIRFGAVPISKWLNAYLDRIEPAHRIHLRHSGVWADDSHRTTWFLQVDETAVCRQLTAQLPRRANADWLSVIRETEDRTWERLSAMLKANWFDGAVVAEVVALLPDDVTLFMGNSSPIRHLDQYGRSRSTRIHAHANRGASGIDGNVSTALGITAVSHRPLVAILGDITFYHDMNGLLPIKLWNSQQSTINNQQSTEDGLRTTDNVTFIVINNNGGSIFNRLPIAQHDPPFTKLFRTPHGLTFEPVAALYGLMYAQVRTREKFTAVVNRAISDPAPYLIELITDNQHDENSRRLINEKTNNE